MLQRQVFKVEGEGGGWYFYYLIFQGLSFLHLEITLCKIVFCIKEKLFFSATIIFMRKSHSKLSKNEPENIP